ncbi:MAG: right-handed parallel beta-helix repeat-containing protein [Haliscomenobacteraceae bacterium CHB4]|nr:right-handed parallel beta-helix repeat-containing protein [Haliscomenobacteraceae bacterium CHB4]
MNIVSQSDLPTFKTFYYAKPINFIAHRSPKLGVFLTFQTIFLFVTVFFSPFRSLAQDCNNLPAFQVNWNNQTITTPAVYNNQNIRVTGTVTFNADITMVRCTVLLDPGATIVVGAGTIFSASSDAAGRTVFFGCTGMWNSITVGNNAAIKFRECTIRDGEYGILLQGNYNWPVSELVNNSFRGNYISIMAAWCPNLGFGNFSGNYFSSNIFPFGNIPLPIALPPHTGEYPLAGVYAAPASGSIGTSGLTNTFTALRYGIYSLYSTLNVNNCTLQRSLNTTLTNTDGVGIYAESSTLNIENLFGGPGCVFANNPEAGILSRYTYGLKVSDATFNGANKYGIRVINSTNTALVNIEDNTFNVEGTNALGAISFVRPPSTGNLTRCYINNNIVNVPDPAVSGFKTSTELKLIEVRALQGPATDNMVIADNYITSSYGGDAHTIHGIWVEDHSDGYQISGNNVTYNYETDAPPLPGVNNVGIGAVSVHGIRNIIGPNNNATATRMWPSLVPTNMADFRRSYIRCGIHVDDSPNFLICRNLSDFAFQGYHFARNCGGVTDFGMNHIRNHYFGLNLCTGGGCESSTTFNAQPYRENLWEVTYDNQSNPARWYQAPMSPPQVTVDGTKTFHTPNPQAAINPQNWFNIDMVGGSPEMTACDSLLSPEIPGFGESEEEFMSGEYHLNQASAEWDYEIFILGHLLRFPSLVNGDLQTQQYFTSKVESSPWKYAQAENMLREAYIPNTSQQSQLDGLLASTRILSDSLAHLEYLESIDTTSLTPSITTARTSVMTTLELNRVQTLAVGEALRNAALANLEAVHSYVSQLPTNEIWEQNRKTVLLHIAANAMGQEPTETDMQALRTVAEQCPATGGGAVLMARSRLPVEEASLFPLEGEDPYCTEERATEKTPIFEGGIILSPNPVSNYLIVAMDKPASGSWQIVASDGRVLATGVFSDTDRIGIDVGQLPEGFYHLRLQPVERSYAFLRFIKI